MERRLCISYETFAKKVDYIKTVDKAGKIVISLTSSVYLVSVKMYFHLGYLTMAKLVA